MNVDGTRALVPISEGTFTLRFYIDEIIMGSGYIEHNVNVKNTREGLKSALVCMLAVSDSLKGTNYFINPGPRLLFKEEVCDHTAIDGMSSFHHGTSFLSMFMTSPYAVREQDENIFDLVAVMHDGYLNGLPYDLGNIIREIEADRENLVKKALFELKLAGLPVDNFENVYNDGSFIDAIKRQIKGSVK